MFLYAQPNVQNHQSGASLRRGGSQQWCFDGISLKISSVVPITAPVMVIVSIRNWTIGNKVMHSTNLKIYPNNLMQCHLNFRYLLMRLIMLNLR